MPTSALITVSFWRVLLERLGRQAAQTAVPILAAVVAAGGAVNVQTIGLGLAGSLAVTLGKAALQYLTDVHATPDSGLAWQWLDRAVPAFFGVLVGLWPVNAEDLIRFSWGPALTAAGSAAVVAVLALYATPPALTTKPSSPVAVRGPVMGDDAAGSDSGRSRVVTALLLAVVVLLAAAIPASAHRPDHHPRPAPAAVVVVAPRVSAVDACTGTLVVHFDTTTLTGHDWAPLMDDGTTVLELRETSGRSGPAGVWGPPPTELGAVASGGEHVLRWPGWARAAGYGLHYTSARVVTGGYRSVAAPIELGCVE